jgi:hypothetical protein
VVPAQIILVCSILNVLWPTLLRIVTTTVEFLVLVLSSYYACARRSDDCYFLEPLFNDGQEAIYVGTIQWTLRAVFCILFLSGLIFTTKRIEKVKCMLHKERDVVCVLLLLLWVPGNNNEAGTTCHQPTRGTANPTLDDNDSSGERKETGDSDILF